jgi:hypothetical protein
VITIVQVKNTPDRRKSDRFAEIQGKSAAGMAP